MNTITVFAHLLNGLLMVGMPIGLGFFLARRVVTGTTGQSGWRLWWIGAAGFVISQIGHIPFNFFLTWLFQQHILPAPPSIAFQIKI